MAATEKLAFTVRAGDRARRRRGAGVERWLIKEVGPVYDAMKKEPSRGIPMGEVFSTLRARHLTRLNASRRGKK